MAEKNQSEHWKVTSETIPEIFSESMRTFPKAVFCKSGSGQLTYETAAGAIRAFAAQLHVSGKASSVAIVLPNSIAFLIAYYGALVAGAKPVLVNYTHPDATIIKLLKTMDVAAIYSNRRIEGLETKHFDDDVALQMAAPVSPSELEPKTTVESIGAVLFSGGTTGLPKQVPHTNRTLIKKIERMEWGWPTNKGEVWLPVAPFTHVYGFLMGVLNPVLRGGTIVIPPRFEPDLIVQMLAEEAITIFGGGPPAIYQGIMASEKFITTKFPNLRVAPGGGAPFPLEVHKKWEKATGLPITEGYGMTEIAPISVNTLSDGIRPGTAGKPVPDTHVEIVDVETGKIVLDIGEAGEIRVKGPHIMTGYEGNSEETAQTLRDGYIYTGDIGSFDADGFLTISDRKKDVIFVKGFNVFPREIEEVLLGYPGITGVCVVGRADERAGELPIAFVTLKGETANEKEIFEHCRQQLAEYKLPVELYVLDSLPLTPAGKVDRQALRSLQ